jgi:hypothetical protein
MPTQSWLKAVISLLRMSMLAYLKRSFSSQSLCRCRRHACNRASKSAPIVRRRRIDAHTPKTTASNNVRAAPATSDAAAEVARCMRFISQSSVCVRDTRDLCWPWVCTRVLSVQPVTSVICRRFVDGKPNPKGRRFYFHIPKRRLAAGEIGWLQVGTDRSSNTWCLCLFVAPTCDETRSFTVGYKTVRYHRLSTLPCCLTRLITNGIFHFVICPYLFLGKHLRKEGTSNHIWCSSRASLGDAELQVMKQLVTGMGFGNTRTSLVKLTDKTFHARQSSVCNV